MNKHKLIITLLLASFLSAGVTLTAQQGKTEDLKAALAAEKAKIEDVAKEIRLALAFMDITLDELEANVAKFKTTRYTDKELAAKMAIRKTGRKLQGLVDNSYMPGFDKLHSATDNAFKILDKMAPPGVTMEEQNKFLEMLKEKDSLLEYTNKLEEGLNPPERLKPLVKEANKVLKE